MGLPKTRAAIDAIASLVEARSTATFLEIATLLRLYEIPSEGPFNLNFDRDSNVVIWSGMSDEMVSVIFALLSEHRMFAHPGEISEYHRSGGVLRLPLADDLVDGGYPSPHWLPVVFRAVPPPSAIH